MSICNISFFILIIAIWRRFRQISTFGIQNNNLDVVSVTLNKQTMRWIPGITYDGYTDLLSYIIHLRDKGIWAGRFDAINLFGLPGQNWDYIIDFTFDVAGQAVVVRSFQLYSFTEQIAYANKKTDGTFGWNGGWKTISYT